MCDLVWLPYQAEGPPEPADGGQLCMGIQASEDLHYTLNCECVVYGHLH
jgi:hypothetical protein